MYDMYIIHQNHNLISKAQAVTRMTTLLLTQVSTHQSLITEVATVSVSFTGLTLVTETRTLVTTVQHHLTLGLTL